MEKKLASPVTLFCAIEERQHDLLRVIAFNERRSISDCVREALEEFIVAKAPDAGALKFEVKGAKVARRSRKVAR